MFKKINLYTRLFTERMEALLAEDALEDDHKTFDSAVRILTLRDYDYLDFRLVKNPISQSLCYNCYTAETGIIVGTRDLTKTMWSS